MLQGSSVITEDSPEDFEPPQVEEVTATFFLKIGSSTRGAGRTLN